MRSGFTRACRPRVRKARDRCRRPTIACRCGAANRGGGGYQGGGYQGGGYQGGGYQGGGYQGGGYIRRGSTVCYFNSGPRAGSCVRFRAARFQADPGRPVLRRRPRQPRHRAVRRQSRQDGHGRTCCGHDGLASRSPQVSAREPVLRLRKSRGRVHLVSMALPLIAARADFRLAPALDGPTPKVRSRSIIAVLENAHPCACVPRARENRTGCPAATSRS